MRGLRGLLSRKSPSPGGALNLGRRPTIPSGGFSFDSLLRGWRCQRRLADALCLLSAPRAVPALERLLMAAPRAPWFAARSKTLKGHGLRWLQFSLQKRRGSRLDDYFGRRNYWRSWMPTSDGVVYGLIGVNVAVFILWRTVDPRFMMENFTISLANFKSGRLHTLITSAFSHMDGDHILINMIGLYFFGTNIGSLFGPRFLLNLYIAGAISGSSFYLVHQALTSPSFRHADMMIHSRSYALGASAAVNAILLLDVFLFPKNIYYLNFFIPVPAALMGAIIIGSDLWKIKKGEERISGSAHLGGALVAALVWARIRKGWI